MINIFEKASDLPELWDSLLSEIPYITKEYLTLLEGSNPCGQRYVLINNRSAFIIYTLKLNVFSYAKMHFDLTVNIIGIPCSVSKAGYKIEESDVCELVHYIKREKKACIILNADHSFFNRCFIRGETLPTCRLRIGWGTFDDYMKSLRSHYRYRLNRALKKGENIKIKKLEDNSQFDEEMYALYESVYEKSNYKLEKLSIDFFRKIPARIYIFYTAEKPIAFVQLSSHEKELFFVFGGMDYELNPIYDLYMNMLIFIVKYGIENRYAVIDMGQTAEDAKMKIGCGQQTKYMHVYHPSLVIRFLIRLFSKNLSYQPLTLKFNVFKEDNEWGV